MRALILAGGAGTRFWPASRRLRPKQLLPLDGEASLLRVTFDRLAPLVEPAAVWVATGVELAAAVARELPEVPPAQILAEPAGRNTTAAIGWALAAMPPEAGDGIVVSLPADHRMADPAAFRAALRSAAEAVARYGVVMTLGVRPHRPEPGYGHLELGEPFAPGGEARRVRRFVEKPAPDLARRFAAGARHLWNAGIFVFGAEHLQSLIRRHAPGVAAGLAAIAARPERLGELYPALPSLSIDHAVMEHLGADELGTVPMDCGWSDLGSWQALAEALPADAAGNVLRGQALAIEAADTLVVAEGGTVAVLGVAGLVVVRAGDAVLVVPRERAQEVRKVVEALAACGREDLL